jgi:uncharacterized membrane protein (UPF0182 family)
MTSRSRWLTIGIIGFLLVLLLGRWVAVGTADHLWAEALGVEETHADIARMRALLFLLAFTGAAVWCLGNLFLVYRSIGSVTVPRRLGNIEIIEAVPRHYLFVGFAVLGLVLALVLSFRSGEWWHARALATGSIVVGLSDPILQRDASYYLFLLPWTRTLHSYVTFLAVVMLGVSLVLYTAVGAVRNTKRRIEVNAEARRHLGALFAVFALALVWGYRLEPAEYLAGVHNVPYDSVLIDVRLPTARLLSAVGLITCAASLLWIRYARTSLILFGWGALGVLSFVGHYLVPAVAAGVRTDLELRSDILSDAREEFTAYAYGLERADHRVVPSPRAGPEAAVAGAPGVAGPVVWDEFAVNRFLNRAARLEPHLRFVTSSLGSYRGPDGSQVPVVIGAREVDLIAARAVDPAFSWERVHLQPYSEVRGVVAVRADVASPDGRPLYIPDLRRPDSVVAAVTDVALTDSTLRFGPTTGQFAVVTERSVTGVPAGGFFRRLALAWRLQSSKLLTSPAVSASSMVLWHRSVRDRLETFAPFATFGSPHPVVANDRLSWTSFGYVASASFPLSARSRWQGAAVGYLRAGFVGIVDAVTGETSVYLLPDADAVSRAWATWVRDGVSPWSELPRGLRAHLVYPAELFATQLQLLRDPEAPRRPGFFGRLQQPNPDDGPATDTYWWLAATGSEANGRLRRMSTIQAGRPPRLAGLVAGEVDGRGPSLTVTRFGQPWESPSPEQTAARFVAQRGVDVGVVGPLKTVRVGDGILSLQSSYTNPVNRDSVPALMGVVVQWAGAVGAAPSFETALNEALASDRSADMVSTDWAVARRWFGRLDAARQSGDWVAFGRAYEELRILLMGDSNPCRGPGCSQ